MTIDKEMMDQATREVLEEELIESKKIGHATDNLLQAIEDIIFDEAIKKKERWNQTEQTNADMIAHSEKMYEERLTDLLIEQFSKTYEKFKSDDGTDVLTFIRTSIGCTFTNFISKRKRGLV